MSSSSLIATLNSIIREINVVAGLSMLIIGLVGGLLTIAIFFSLHTFRDNPSAFYLIVMSLVNVGQLLTGLLSRVTINLSGIDWTQLSLFYCKFRMYLIVTFTNISMLSMCLATIDQYLATCQRPNWQRLSNLKSARLCSITIIGFSALVAIPCLIYYDHTISVTTGLVTCVPINDSFAKFNIYFYRLVMTNVVPLLVTIIYGLLTYRNVKQIVYRTVPLVRRELDKQLTTMILVQDIVTVITLSPIMISGIISLNPNIFKDALAEAQFQLFNVISIVFYYLYFISPFYIYFCASERFRRQLKYVFFDIHFNQCRQRKIHAIQAN